MEQRMELEGVLAGSLSLYEDPSTDA
jgi:hypothetical protein